MIFLRSLLLVLKSCGVQRVKVGDFLEANLFIKESNGDCLRLVAIIKHTVLNLLK